MPVDDLGKLIGGMKTTELLVIYEESRNGAHAQLCGGGNIPLNAGGRSLAAETCVEGRSIQAQR